MIVTAPGRTKITNHENSSSFMRGENRLAYEVLLVDPSNSPLLGLREMILDVFITGSSYRGRGNAEPADLEGLSDVQDLFIYLKDGLKVWVHEGNVEAVLRLVGESRGKQVLYVVLK